MRQYTITLGRPRSPISRAEIAQLLREQAAARQAEAAARHWFGKPARDGQGGERKRDGFKPRGPRSF